MGERTAKARVYLAMVEDRVIDWKEHDAKHHGGHFDEAAYKRHEISCTLRDAENEKQKADRIEGAENPQVSSEARHSTKLEFGRWLENGKINDPFKTYSKQLAFQRETQKATDGLFGEIASVFGVPGVRKVGENNLVGYYDDNYTDGLQEEIELPIKTDANGNQMVDEDARKVMDAYCAMQALLRRQDAVTWNAPLESNDFTEQNGFYIDAGNYIDFESYQDLYGEFNKLADKFCTDDQIQAIKDGAVGFISTRRGVRIIDFTGKLKADGYDNLRRICETLNETYGEKPVSRFKSDGGYIGTEKFPWSDDESGDGREFIEKLEATGMGEKLKRIYEDYAGRVYEAESAAAKRLGYDKPLKKHTIWK